MPELPELGVVLVHSRGPVSLRAQAVPGSTTIGREGEIAIEDPGASRVHARLENRAGVLWVFDAGSRNGTFVNGRDVGRDGLTAEPGSVIRIARSLFVVHADVNPFSADLPDAAGLVGGPALDDARVCIATIAPTPSPVLVLGETGTGKELVARAIHVASGRAGNFVALNCAAVSAELVDAELFGHARGAFSGATQARPGLFRAADGGTLFLDEVGEMSPAVQAKLLRTLETKEVRALGEDRSTLVDVRVVAATNREVDELVDSGDFRGDLLHRLAGLRIALPRLAARTEDVPALAEHFLVDTGLSLSVMAIEQLLLHSWPGNVRELRNVVGAALELAKRRGHAEIESEDLPRLGPAPRAGSTAPADDPGHRIRAALTEAEGDVGRAAALVSMSRSSLYEALRRLGIDPRSYRRR